MSAFDLQVRCVVASIGMLLVSPTAFAVSTCTELEAALTAAGQQAYDTQHANVLYCLSLYPNGYVCGSDVTFTIESQQISGLEQRRRRSYYVGPQSTGGLVSISYTTWETCSAGCPEGTKLWIPLNQCKPVVDTLTGGSGAGGNGGGGNSGCGEGLGNPIYPMTGAKREEVALGIAIGGLSLTVSYNSARQLDALAGASNAKDSGDAPSFGPLWLGNLHRKLVVTPVNLHISALRGDGVAISYTNTTGVYTSDADNNDKLVAITGGYRYTDARNQSVETYTSTGQLSSLADALGRTLAFDYSSTGTPITQAPAAGYLTQITDDTGRTVKFTYALPAGGVATTDGHVTSITTPAGGLITPSYDATGNLTGLTWEDGKTRQFLYENPSLPWALTGVVDERNLRYSTFGYDTLGRAISTEHAGGVEHYSLTYQAPPQNYVSETYDAAADVIYRVHGWQAPAGTTVTGPLGAVASMDSTMTAGFPRISGNSQPAGSGCAASTSAKTFDANGNVLSHDDFKGQRSCFAYDSSNRQTTRVEGLTNTVDCTTVTPASASLPTGSRKITTTWHPDWHMPATVTAPGTLTTNVFQGQIDTFNGNTIANCTTAAFLPNGKPLPVLCKRVVQATQANGTLDTTVISQIDQFSYDSAGRMLTSKDALNRTANYTYYLDTTFPVPDTSVSLLLHGDGANASTAMIDTSGKGKSVSVNGNAQITTAQSKFGGAAIAFDGAGDYLTIPYSSDFDFKAGDFTIETWVYKNGNNANYSRLWNPNGDVYDNISMMIDGSGNFGVWASIDGVNWNYSLPVVANLANGQWYHLAVSRTGGTLLAFVNGVKYTVTTALGTTPLYSNTAYARVIGGQTGVDRALNGYIDDFRITKGLARYTTDFTPPTAALPDPSAIVANPNDSGHTRGDLQSITNAAGHTTHFDLYDRAGRLLKATDPKGVVTDISYTPRGWTNSVTVTPPGGTARLTSYAYDDAGQLTVVTTPDGASLSYAYDDAHRLTGVTDAKGNSVNYTLDNTGKRIAEDIKDPNGILQRNISRSFDALNRLQQVTGATQ